MSRKKWFDGYVKWNCICYFRPKPLGVEEFDARRIVSDMIKAGVDTLAWESIEGFFNSKIQKKHPGIGDRDLVKELGEEAHRHGLRFVPSLRAFSGPFPLDAIEEHWGIDPGIAEKHPEWFVKTIDGKSGGICPNSPYIDEYTIPLLKEIAGWEYTDGIWLDQTNFVGPGKTCFCDNCRKKYKSRFGVDLPAKEDWSDPNWRRFVRWRYECFRDWFKKSYEAIKSVNPDVMVQQNYLPFEPSYHPHDTGEVGSPDYQDVLSIEAFFEKGSIWMPGMRTKLGRAVGREKKPVWIIVHSSLWAHPVMAAPMPRPEAEMRLVCADVIANGGLPQMWQQLYEALHPNYSWGGCHLLESVFKDMDLIRNYIIDVKSLKYAALLYSQQNRDYYGLANTRAGWMEGWTDREAPSLEMREWGFGAPSEYEWGSVFKRWGGYMLGFYKAFLKEHVPFDLFVDAQLSDPRELAKYKVIVLPNAVCLSDDQVKRIQLFVKNGGGLVATYKTSLADEQGVIKDDFALSDVFHASLKGTTESEALLWSYVQIVRDHPVLQGVDQKLMLGHKREQLLVEEKPEAEVLARIAYPRRKYYDKGDKLFGRNPRPPGPATSFPALIASTYGEGRVVYFPGQIDMLNMLWGFSEYARILGNAVEWAAKANNPMETDAPSTVEITVQEQPEDDRTLVHFVNFTTASPWTSIGEVPTANMIDEVIPVFDINVKLRTTKDKTNKVRTIVSNKELKWKTSGEKIEFVVPKVHIHEIVAIE